MRWATFWATFSQAHLVTLAGLHSSAIYVLSQSPFPVSVANVMITKLSGKANAESYVKCRM
jgi:hypothetical protein